MLHGLAIQGGRVREAYRVRKTWRFCATDPTRHGCLFRTILVTYSMVGGNDFEEVR